MLKVILELFRKNIAKFMINRLWEGTRRSGTYLIVLLLAALPIATICHPSSGIS